MAAFGRPVRFAELLEAIALSQGDALPAAADADRAGDAGLRPGAADLRARACGWCGWPMRPGGNRRWRRSREPHLDALAAELGETVHLAQLDGGQVLYVDKRRRRASRSRCSARPGKVGPAYCTGRRQGDAGLLPDDGAGRACWRSSRFHRFTASTILRPEALCGRTGRDPRRAAVAFDREEHEPGIICVAAPILTPWRARAGRAVGDRRRPGACDLAELGRLRADGCDDGRARIADGYAEAGAFRTQTATAREERTMAGVTLAGRGQALRRGAGDPRRRPGGRGRRVLRLRRPLGLRQVHAAAHDRGAGGDDATGTIRIGERDVTRVDPAERGVAMVFQTYALYPHMTVAREHGLRAAR